MDRCARQKWLFLASALQRAYDFHKDFHVNAKTLQQKFTIPRADARRVVMDCPQCVVHHHPQTLGVNPRGMLPLKIWQMDVTHVSEFGMVKYVHMSVSVDTWCHSRHAYVG